MVASTPLCLLSYGVGRSYGREKGAVAAQQAGRRKIGSGINFVKFRVLYMAVKKLCKVDGCENPSRRRGWCNAHYHRWKAHGDPLGGGTPHGALLRWIVETALPYNGDDCLIWPFGRDSRGYGFITVDGKHQYASRYVCEQTYGQPPTDDHEAAHSCGKGHEGCVNPNHLSWKTRNGNHADKLTHGTHNRGERHNLAKLTEADVRRIRKLSKSITGLALADMYGVSPTTIYDIINGYTWGWLDAA